jgi:Fe-S-cluster containining protein
MSSRAPMLTAIVTRLYRLGVEDLTSALCQACGMCCDGSLFGRARLDADEVPLAKKNRLRIVANGASFEQPCSALARGSCTIYEERPRACRGFVCRLRERFVREGGDVAPYVERVRRARELLTYLGELGEVPAELATLLDEDFARA